MADFPEVTEARKITVEPGDIIVLRYGGLLSADMMERMRCQAREAFAPARVVVLDRGMTLGVLTTRTATGPHPGDTLAH
jgi:hypothetical protein